MHSYRRLLLILCTTFYLFSIQTTAQTKDTTRHKIIFTADWGYPPYEFINDQGKPDGFNIEVIEALMAELKMDYEIKMVHWSDALNLLQQNKADAISGMGYSAERASRFNFTTPHSYLYPSLIYRKSSHFKHIDDLAGKKIILQKKSLITENFYNAFFENNPAKPEQTFFVDNLSSALELLNNGKYDAAVCSYTATRYLIEKKQYSNLNVAPLNTKPIEYCIATSLKNKALAIQLNQGLEQLKAKGIYNNIYNKWFGIYDEPLIPGYLFWVIGGLLGLLCLTALIIFLIRNQVKKATNEVNKLNKTLGLAILSGDMAVWYLDIQSLRFYILHGHSVLPHRASCNDIYHYMPREDIEKHQKMLNDIISGKKQTDEQVFRYRNESQDDYHFYQVIMTGDYDKNGKLVQIIGTEKNVTAKFTEDAQITSKRKSLDLAMESASIGAWIYDCNTNKYEVLYGLQLIRPQTDPTRIPWHIHPDDQSKYDAYLKNCFENQASHNDSIIIRIDRGDKYAYFESAIAAVENNNGKITHYIGSLKDLTAVYELNEKIRYLYEENQTILQNLSVGVAIYDKAGMLQYINQASATLFGITDIEEYLKTPSYFYDHPLVSYKYKEKFRKGEEYSVIVKYNLPQNAHEATAVSEKCDEIYLEIKMGIVRNSNGEIEKYIILLNDITRQYTYQEQLKENKELWKRLYTEKQHYISALNIAVKGTELIIGYYDAIQKELFTLVDGKFEKSAATFEHLIRRIHPEEQEQYREELTGLLNGTIESQDSIYRLFNRQTKEFAYFEVHTTAVKDENGEVQQIIGTQRNINHHIEHEEELKAFKYQVKLAVKASEMIQWEYNCATNLFNAINDPLTDGKNTLTPEEYISTVHPEDMEIPQKHLKQMQDKNINEYNMEVRMQIPGYEGWRSVNVSGAAVRNYNGEIIKYVGFRRDNTNWVSLNQQLKGAIREAENTSELLRNIIHEIPLGIFIKDIDDDFRYLIMNQQLAELQHRKASVTLGKTDYDIFDKEIADIFRKDDLETIRQAGKPHICSKSIIFDGQEYFFETTETVFKTGDGRQLLIGAVADISEKEKTRIELQKAKETAEQSDRLKSAFLANMSHEIRTPLNAIVGFSQLITESCDAEEKAEFTRIIMNNNDLLLKLINDILDLSKIESEVVGPKLRKMELTSVMKDIHLSMQPHIRRNVEFICHTPYEACFVIGDKERFTQVITNFLTNANKFTESGYIKMGYEYVDKGIRFYVEDTGIGIEEENIPKVFMRFQKLDDFTQGTGLGMAICKAIMDARKGKIGVESKVGSGSTFWGWFPTEMVTDAG
ncbi:MAG: transporter substrate-binding domain-containing protein [Bacteroidales bacterium]